MSTHIRQALPLGTTILTQLRDFERRSPTNAKVLRTHFGSNQFLQNQKKDPWNPRAQSAARTTRMADKLRDIFGINVDETYVCMAKTAVDRSHDWFPELRTSLDVIEALRPYAERMGTVPFGKQFFNRDIHSIFYDPEYKRFRNPALQILKDAFTFLLKEMRNGYPMKEWGNEHLTVYSMKQELFGDIDPLPEVVDYDSFILWLLEKFSDQEADSVADTLGMKVLSIRKWREQRSTPSRELMTQFILGAAENYPEWFTSKPVLRVKTALEDPADAQEFQAPKRASVPNNVPSSATPSVPPPHSGGTEPNENAFEQLIAQFQRTTASRQEQQRVLGRVIAEEEKLAEILATVSTEIQRREPPRVQNQDLNLPADEVSEGDLHSGRAEIGERKNGLRFVLTRDNFTPLTGEWNDSEIEDTFALLEEIARRAAVLNSSAPEVRERVLAALEPASRSVAIQLGSLEQSDRSAAIEAISARSVSLEISDETFRKLETPG